MPELAHAAGGDLHHLWIALAAGGVSWVLATLLWTRLRSGSKQSGDLYRKLADSSPQAIALIAPDYTLRASNELMREWYGIDVDQHAGTDMEQLLLPDAHQRIRAAFDRAMKGERVGYEASATLYDGKQHEIRTDFVPQLGPDGAVVGVLACALDITTLVQTNRRLADREFLFDTLVSSSRDIISRHSIDGEFLFVSEAVRVVLGHEPAEVVGKALRDFAHPEDHTALEVLFRDVTESDAPDLLVFRMKHKAERWIWIEMSLRLVVRDSDRREFVAVCRDISDRLAADERLRESQRRLREFASAIDEAFWLVQLDPPALLYANEAASEMWQRPGDQDDQPFESTQWLRSIHTQDRKRVAKAFRKWTAGENGEGFDETYRGASETEGEPRWSRTRAVLIHSESGPNRVAGTTIDVTRSMRTSERLRRTTRAQDMLLRELDHRVKNTLGGLLTLIDLSAGRAESVEVFSTDIRMRVQAMTRVHTMLSVSRWRPVDLRELVTGMCPPECQPQAQFLGLNIEVPAQQATPLGMVMQELFSNSMKYGALVPGCGGAIRVAWNTVDEGQGERTVRIDWRETGGVRNDTDRSTGLGMQLIQGFVRFELRGSFEARFDEEGADHTILITLSEDQTDEALHEISDQQESR